MVEAINSDFISSTDNFQSSIGNELANLKPQKKGSAFGNFFRKLFGKSNTVDNSATINTIEEIVAARVDQLYLEASFGKGVKEEEFNQLQDDIVYAFQQVSSASKSQEFSNTNIRSLNLSQKTKDHIRTIGEKSKELPTEKTSSNGLIGKAFQFAKDHPYITAAAVIGTTAILFVSSQHLMSEGQVPDLNLEPIQITEEPIEAPASLPIRHTAYLVTEEDFNDYPMLGRRCDPDVDGTGSEFCGLNDVYSAMKVWRGGNPEYQVQHLTTDTSTSMPIQGFLYRNCEGKWLIKGNCEGRGRITIKQFQRYVDHVCQEGLAGLFGYNNEIQFT